MDIISVTSTILFKNSGYAIADLHLHGRYAISVSKNTTPMTLIERAKQKGIQVLGTGDCLYKPWYDDFKPFFDSKEVKIVPTTEVSLHFKRHEKNYAFHFILVFSSFEVIPIIANKLRYWGNVVKIARPELYLEPKDFLDCVREIDEACAFIPAHVFTPYFGVLGRRGFTDISKLGVPISSIETGISADPAMCKSVKTLDKAAIVSFSDAHSSETLGRESTVVKTDIDICKAICKPVMTIECYPELGKYHRSGHRKCNFVLEDFSDRQTCPVCGKPLTLGVADRLLALEQKKSTVPLFVRTIPLAQILTVASGSKAITKKSKALYAQAIQDIGPELYILICATEFELARVLPDLAVKIILDARENKVVIKPGFDGLFGQLCLS